MESALILPLLEFRPYPSNYWNSDLMLPNIRIVTLFFQTLEFWSYLPNIGILASSFLTIIRMLIFTWTNFGIVTLSFQLIPINLIMTLSLQTLELWPYLFKYWNSDLFLPKLWPDPFKHWNAALFFQTLEYSEHRTAKDPTAFIYL